LDRIDFIAGQHEALQVREALLGFLDEFDGQQFSCAGCVGTGHVREEVAHHDLNKGALVVVCHRDRSIWIPGYAAMSDGTLHAKDWRNTILSADLPFHQIGLAHPGNC